MDSTYKQMTDFLVSLGTETVSHSNKSFLAHLIGVYRVVEPPKKLVYTWRWESEPDAPETLVTVEFLDRGGATDLVLTHELFPNEAAKGKHEHGWTGCLDKLARVVA